MKTLYFILSGYLRGWAEYPGQEDHKVDYVFVRLNQIVQNEFYKVAFRKKVCTSIEEIQTDLDEFMNTYNNERTNQGKHCQGRTPMQTFEEGEILYQKYVFENSEEEDKHAA